MRIISSHLPGVLYRAKQETPKSFRFQYMSHGAERLFGISIEKILAGPAFSSESVHPSDRENFLKALEDSVQLEKPFSWQGKIQTSGKVQNWIRVKANPIQSSDGVIWHGIILDINQEKLLEVEVRNSQDRMSEAQTVISLARMASSLAREISHPLAVIKGMSEIFGQTSDLSALPEREKVMMAESVQSNVKRIEDIVNYLEVSSNDDVSENFSSFPLRSILDNALHSAKSVISLVNLDIVVRLPSATLNRCRPARLSQVLREIVINACEADFKKDPKLQIVGYVSDNAVRIEFEDSGQVISPEIATYIFDPFFSTKQSGVGRGLGLSRSRAIVEAHGGTLVYDDSRFASTFILTLPHVSLLEES